MYSELIIKRLEEITGLVNEEIHLETPENEEFGDYSSNVAMQLQSQSVTVGTLPSELRTSFKSPRERAKILVDKLDNDKELQGYIDKIEVAGPGFINFWLKKEILFSELEKIISTGKKYGNSEIYRGKKIMVEYAHPNTHKELHIGHMRTLILGEALSRILERAGAKVFRANYQGDIGPHVAKAIWGTRKLLTQRNMRWEDVESKDLSEKVHLLGEGYVLANQEYESNKNEIDALNTKIYEKDPEILADYERTRRWSLEYYDSFYSRFGTKFDKLYFESQVAEKGKEIVLNHLGDVFEESEGAIIFNGEKYGLHKRVFVTKDRNPTYEAKDMALAPLQYSDFPFDLNIHVVANEQKDYFKVIFKALELIDSKFKNREYHLSMGMVNLIGKKISSRTGEIYTVEQLLNDVKSLVVPLIKEKDLSQSEKDKIAEQVTIASIKYSMLKVNPSADVSFDLKKSVSVEGDSGPYLQYTYARTQSVSRKAGITNLQFPIINDNYNLNNEELAILRTFIRFSDVIAMSAKNYSPNLLCNYLYDLASKYNFFYQKHDILEQRTKDKEKSKFRLALTSATGQILKNGLNILGIQAPENM